MYEEVNSLKIINFQPTLTGVDLSFIYFYVKNELSVNSVVIVSEKLRPLCTFRIFFPKTASRAVINVKFEQKSASRAEVKHRNGLKTILFLKILGRTHFKHVFRNYGSKQIISLYHSTNQRTYSK